MTATVIQFAPHRPDIPTGLRELADRIDAGDHGRVTSIAMVIEDDTGLFLDGFGGADPMRSLAMFDQARAIIKAGFHRIDE